MRQKANGPRKTNDCAVLGRLAALVIERNMRLREAITPTHLARSAAQCTSRNSKLTGSIGRAVAVKDQIQKGLKQYKRTVKGVGKRMVCTRWSEIDKLYNIFTYKRSVYVYTELSSIASGSHGPCTMRAAFVLVTFGSGRSCVEGTADGEGTGRCAGMGQDGR